MRKQVNLTPATPEELLDSCWERLDEMAKAEGRKMRGSEVRYIDRAQLAEFMTEAALLAIGASSLAEPDLSPRPVPALLQSLKVMGEQAAEEGRPGWTVICQRAIGCLERLGKDVTRFLEYPDLQVRHATVPTDMRIEAATLQEDGRVICSCITSADERRTFALDGLVAAGVIDDFVRLAVTDLSRAVIEDAISQLPLKPLLPPVAYLADMEDHPGTFVLTDKDDPEGFPVFGSKDGAFGTGGTFATGGVVDPAHPRSLAVRQSGVASDDHEVDHCNGCDVPEANRVNLPEGWKPGDIVPSGLTIHATLRDLRKFVFIGDPHHQLRHYFTGDYPQQAEVHDLQAHPEYVMEPGGVGTKPAEDDGSPLCGV